jgi:hypothetical protein
MVMITVLSALAGAVWWRLLYPAGAEPAAAAGCTATELEPHAVRVRVYNASAREGLAGTVAGQLGRRGFAVVATANDPLIDLRPITTGWAEIRYGAAGTRHAQLLRAHVPGAKLFRDGRKDAVVDVALGPAFKRLSNPAELARAMAALRAAAGTAQAQAGRAQAGQPRSRQGIAAGGSPTPGAATC